MNVIKNVNVDLRSLRITNNCTEDRVKWCNAISGKKYNERSHNPTLQHQRGSVMLKVLQASKSATNKQKN